MIRKIFLYFKYYRTLKCIYSEMSEKYNMPLSEARKRVFNSWIMDMLEDPDMVYEMLYHYDAKVWAKMIIEDYFPGDKIND